MREIKQLGTGETTSIRFFINSTDGKTGSSGLTPAISVALPGTVFSTVISPLTTDIGVGFYDVQITTAHTPTLGEVALHYTATAGQDPSDLKFLVTPADWSNVKDIYDASLGAWKVDTTADTLTLFRKDDTTTSVASFNLTRLTGTAPYYTERAT